MLSNKLKVLCEFTPSGPSFVRTGWGRVFSSCGHDFRFWDRDAKSAFDAFSEFEPDLLICCTYSVDRALAKCMAARPNMKVAMFASAWGPLVDNLDREKYPLVVASEAEKVRLMELKEATGKPDFVFVHVTDKYLDGTMGGWRTIGIEPHGILNAADVFSYAGGKYRQAYDCDAAFVGGYWGYKARNLDSYLLPLCHPSEGLSVRIFGNRPWPVANYLGPIDEAEVKDVFASAAVCPNVSEPHSTELGWDLIERLFKVPCAGGMLVSDHVDELFGVFGDSVPTAKTPQEFHKLVRHFAGRPLEREAYVEAARKVVLAGHTYHHRVARMLELLGLEVHSKSALENLRCLLTS